MIFEPNNRVVQVRGGERLLFVLNTEKMQIEIKRGDETHAIKVHDLLEFARTSQRPVFHAQVIFDEADDVVDHSQFE